MAPYSLADLIQTKTIGRLGAGDLQSRCIEELGCPEDSGGTSSKQKRPSIFKYGNLQLLFERPELSLSSLVIVVSDEGAKFKNDEGILMQLFEQALHSACKADFEHWATVNDIPMKPFSNFFGTGFEIDTGIRLFLNDERSKVSKLEIDLLHK